ncbi:polysaccharide biosynthesis/export family protein [Oceanidesulfovibrio marinus]|uniref:polysaccharide biosynthesis/export family protein n=1 Tax=Oceanidesulfovibrio marinus TaxID=370038 RepID=UPI00142EB6B6|nr:polysaccharide biosynthesis/export family protein [Oceanidesulfovibrio marinus]
MLCVCLALSGCGYYAQPIAESEIHNEPQQELHTLSTGDEIEVRFTYWPELNEIQQIRPDGYVDLGIVNEVRAAGKTVPELTAELKTRYASTLKNPEISIVVRNYAKEYVYVGGEVLTPGLIALGPEMTALEAIMAAGGQLKASARMSGVILVRHTGGKRYAAAIDLAEQIDGKESVPVVLQPRDIVFVPRTPIDHNRGRDRDHRGCTAMIADREHTLHREALEELLPREGRSSIRDILQSMFRHKRTIMLFFLGVVVSVLIVSLLTPNVYESDARVLLRVGRESVGVDASVVGPTSNLNQFREEEVNSELSVLESRFLSEKVVEKLGVKAFSHDRGLISKLLNSIGLGLGDNPDDLSRQDKLRMEVIKEVHKHFKVEALKKSATLTLSYRDEDPHFAQEVLHAYIDAYLQHHIEVYKSQATPEFFEREAASILQRLTDKENDLKDFQKKHHIASVDLQKQTLQDRISRLKAELGGGTQHGNLDGAMPKISSSRARIAYIEKVLKDIPQVSVQEKVVGETNGGVASNAIKRRLLDLRLKEIDMAGRYTDSYRPLINLREQIKEAELALSKEKETLTQVTEMPDPIYSALSRELEEERVVLREQLARKDAIEESLQNAENELNELVSSEVEFKQLQREVNVLQNEYLQYRDNLLRSKIANALDQAKISNVSIVQPPTFPVEHILPKRTINLLVGMFFGLFGGIGLALLLEYFDDSLKSEEEVERRLKLPVIASVSNKEFEKCI